MPADLPGDHRRITADPGRDLGEPHARSQAPERSPPVEQGQHLPYGGIRPKSKIKYSINIASLGHPITKICIIKLKA
jgi:hypothetical protein